MKTNINMNTLTTKEKQSIWVPKLVFFNTKTKENTQNDDKSFTLARRDSTYKFSETDVKDNIYIFPGSDNPFVMSRSYDVEWICDYDMRWYPFDTQVSPYPVSNISHCEVPSLVTWCLILRETVGSL